MTPTAKLVFDYAIHHPREWFHAGDLIEALGVDILTHRKLSYALSRLVELGKLTASWQTEKVAEKEKHPPYRLYKLSC